MKNPKTDKNRFPADTDAKEAFEANALLSHDVRSAVSDIIGALQLLDTDQMWEANKQHLARIGASAGLLYRLIDQSNPAPSVSLAGDQEHSFLLTKLLDTLKKRWSGRAKDNRVDLIFLPDFEPQLTLDCDQLALERLLSNLLDNSIKFAKSGTVALSVRRVGETLQIDVQDDGPGFSQNALDLIFTFGGRPEESKVPGSGLGLFICKQMVHQLNGNISAQNTDTGALVSASIPCRFNALHQIDIGSGWVREAPQKRLDGIRVLLAEDNKTNQLVAGQMLEFLGADVAIANDGIEALALVETQPFDLAILDIEMPRKSGLELIRDIRSRSDSVADMTIVAVTAYVMRDHRERIMAIGADGIIAKPLMNVDAFGKELQRMMSEQCHKPDLDAPRVVQPERMAANAQPGQSVAPVDDYIYGSLYKTIGPAAFSELLVKLLQDLNTVSAQLKTALEARDTEQLRRASHVLISLAGAVGAFELLESAQLLNSAAHGDDYEKIVLCEHRSLELLEELVVFLAAPASKSEDS